MVQSIQETTTLHNGLPMPWLGLGTFKAAEDGEVEHAIQWAAQLGYRSIDTAMIYQNEAGVGRGVRQTGIPREQFFITTKVWNSDQGYDQTRKAFEQSLQRLEMDYVDLYLVHWPVKEKYKDTWHTVEKIYRDGQAKAIGVCNFLVHHLEDLLPGVEVVPMVNQVEFHPRLVQPQLLEFCRQHKIQLEAWSPLMRGQIENLPGIMQIAERHQKTPAQVVLRWDLQHEVVTIPKSTKREHLAANAAIFDFELSEDEMAALDSRDKNDRIGPDPDNFQF